MQRWLLGTVLLTALAGTLRRSSADEPAAPDILTGPGTEKRFPPLVVPDGFRATLFACDPLVEYPSVIAIGPRPGTLFVAHDYMTGLGVEIIRRDEVRLLDDTDADGYADQSTVFAGEFNSIQGLAYFNDDVFVMHAPLLTKLRDTDGDGVADERRDLIKGLGLPPEENSNRLHCANGVVAGHDGWLYLALGDRGCDVERPEGDRLLFQQGGILRCRPDGTDLHVFSTGLRNIYDVVLDDELNVFVRDNENDGGDYMIRVCHCFFGSDHGYPYHYYERPAESMPPLADLGRGSSAGGTSYLETAFPPEYRDSLFFCEWGRAVVRYRAAHESSSFESMTEVDFATGARDDPYGFKPTDLVVDRDGSLLISDWCDGQRPKRGRGRIYRVSYAAQSDEHSQPNPDLQQATTASLIHRLDSHSYLQRVAAQLEIQRRGEAAVTDIVAALKSGQLGLHGQLHAVWIIALAADDSVPDTLLNVVRSDADVRVRAQAIRAIGDLTDPILAQDRINTEVAGAELPHVTAELAAGGDPRVVLDSLIVMRRGRWRQTPNRIAQYLTADDPALNHAAAQALRHSENWPNVVQLLGSTPRLRRLALHAIAEQRVPFLADHLINRLHQDTNAEHRREYADALARIVREPEPWTYWGFRPDPRPAATVDWDKTSDIEAALNGRLADPEFDVRAFVLNHMQREGIVPALPSLADWLSKDADEQRVMGILDALKMREPDRIGPILAQATRRSELTDTSRLHALSILIDTPGDDSTSLPALGAELEDGPVLASVLNEFGRRPKLAVDTLLLRKLNSPHPVVRAAAIRSLGRRKNADATGSVGRLLQDADRDVQLAAVEAAGRLRATTTNDALLSFAAGSDRALIAASLDALRELNNGRAVAHAAECLDHRETRLSAIQYLRTFGTPDRVEDVVRAAALNPGSDFQNEVVQTLMEWRKRFADSHRPIRQAIATIHGQHGQPLAWSVAGPLAGKAADRLRKNLPSADQRKTDTEDHSGAVSMIAAGSPAEVRFEKPNDAGADSVWLAWTPIHVDKPMDVEILASATGILTLSLDGRPISARDKPGGFVPDSDRVNVTLNSGTNMLLVAIEPGADESPRFHLRFRRRSSKAEHERLIAYALKSRGNVNRGREVFTNADKSLCIRCHRLGAEGGRIGPDLTGIGSRFSRIHLIESILEPGRTVAPSYATVVVALNDGRVLTGIRVSESNDTLVLGDNQGKLHQISRSDIDEITRQKLSTMPDGLEKKLTEREFADLLAFLESQKSQRGRE